jgi:hypothetical protein
MNDFEEGEKSPSFVVFFVVDKSTSVCYDNKKELMFANLKEG